MDFTERLRSLEAAEGDPARLSLATVDFAFPALSAAERTVLKESLECAAIPHWCDESTLAALIGITPQESAERLARLRLLSVVEPFPARGKGAVNVHEAARLALRKAIAADPGGRFRILSSRAVKLFENDSTPERRVEWIYQLLCADPEMGATALEHLDREWSRVARPEDRYALAAVLGELDESGLVHGRARLQVLIVMALTRVSRGEAAALADVAALILELARSVADHRAEADAHALMGDVMQAQGKLTESGKAYEEYLRISRQLAQDEPSKTALRQELAVACNRVGAVLEAQGKLTEALAAFEEALAISLQLAQQEPNNAGWQSDLAAAHSRVGGVLEAQDKLAAAHAAFAQDLAISRRLAQQDPMNAGWQSALAAGLNRMGGVLEAQGRLTDALAAFEEALAISLQLAQQDPSNAGWRSDLAAAHSRVGGALQAQGKLTEAQAAFEEDLAISRRLAQQDPSNANWQSGLAATYNRLGACLRHKASLRGAVIVRGGSGDHPTVGPTGSEQRGLAVGTGSNAQPAGRCASGAGQTDRVACSI